MNYAPPLNEIGKIISFSAVDDSVRNHQAKINCERVTKRLMDNAPPHDRKAILVCYGPSLKETYKVIPSQEGDVFSVSASHQFLIDRGIIPHAHIDCDPRHRNAEQLKPHKDVRYWIASCVHPAFTEKLKGHDVSLWHIHNGYASENFIWDLEPDAWLLVGGGSVGLRAISLLYSQGYREIDIHGMDSSYADDEEYAGKDHIGPPKKQIISVQCKGRWFKSALQMIDYARQFQSDLRLWPDAKIRLYGDGLLQEMCRP